LAGCQKRILRGKWENGHGNTLEFEALSHLPFALSHFRPTQFSGLMELNRMGKVCLALALPGFLRVLGFLTGPLLTDAEIHRTVGEPSRIVRAAPGAPLTLVTWNIERGQEYEAVLAALRLLDADILLLQEVDRFTRRTGYRDVARDLAHALDMNWVAAGEFQEIGEGRGRQPAFTGQAILSRLPISAAEVLRFTAQARWKWSINPVQPRRGGRIALKARTGGLLLYNTHIESGGDEGLQRRQIAQILADEAREIESGIPVVVGGDFNNGPVLQGPVFTALGDASFADALGDATERESTSSGSQHPIDWIFVKNIEPIRGRIVNTKAASDHFPVLTALELVPAVALGR
jgi:endonuclease/exonuclease/phosphatase family metal-dependent hydrolase